MATAVYSDFKIYQPEFQAGLWEGISQAVNAFNGASQGTIRLVVEAQKGQYEKTAIFTAINNLITRRNPASTSSADAVKPVQDELISVKVDRKIGPVEFTLDSLRKSGVSNSEMSFVLGEMIGQKKAQDMLNTGILACEAALEGQASTNGFDATGLSVKTMTTEHLVSGLQKMGDMGSRVIAWIMHSKPFYDLVKEQISAKITNVADRVVFEGSPVTLNRPVIVSDVPALWDLNASATDTYNTLGLVSDAVVVKESEQSDLVSDIITGNENLTARVQGEYAMNLGVRGFKWDVTNGGASPTDAALATTTNWDLVLTTKDLAGIRIKTQ